MSSEKSKTKKARAEKICIYNDKHCDGYGGYKGTDCCHLHFLVQRRKPKGQRKFYKLSNEARCKQKNFVEIVKTESKK